MAKDIDKDKKQALSIERELLKQARKGNILAIKYFLDHKGGIIGYGQIQAEVDTGESELIERYH